MKKLIFLILIITNIFASEDKLNIISQDIFSLEEGDQDIFLNNREKFIKGKFGINNKVVLLSKNKDIFQLKIEEIISSALLTNNPSNFFVTYKIKNNENKIQLKNYICIRSNKKECNSCLVANGITKKHSFECQETILEKK